MEHVTLLVKNNARSFSEPAPASHSRREGGAEHTLMTQGAPARAVGCSSSSSRKQRKTAIKIITVVMIFVLSAPAEKRKAAGERQDGEHEAAEGGDDEGKLPCTMMTLGKSSGFIVAKQGQSSSAAAPTSSSTIMLSRDGSCCSCSGSSSSSSCPDRTSTSGGDFCPKTALNDLLDACFMSIATGINGMSRVVSIASSELFIAFFISSKPGSRHTKGR
jgi:hypothetical protein